MPTCSAYGCTSSTRHKGNREKGIFFHDFPKRDKSPERFRYWVEYCNRRDFDPGINQKSACLCSRHFRIADMDESQLLKIKMMPSANLRGPRLKPGSIPTVAIDSISSRKTSKIPHIPIAKRSMDSIDPSTKKFQFTSSLIKWRESMVGKDAYYDVDEFKTTSSKSTQCELGLEMHRYVSSPEYKNKKRQPLVDDSDNGDNACDNTEEEESDFSGNSICESDGENDNCAANGKEASFAAWGNLLLLFRICNVCSKEVTDIHHGMRSNKIFVRSYCSCGNKVTWTSQPR